MDFLHLKVSDGEEKIYERAPKSIFQTRVRRAQLR